MIAFWKTGTPLYRGGKSGIVSLAVSRKRDGKAGSGFTAADVITVTLDFQGVAILNIDLKQLFEKGTRELDGGLGIH